MQYFDLARQGQRAMAKRWQGAKAARKGLGPWWNVLRAGFETLSKCRISTWQGRGKGRKVHRRVSCPSETCLGRLNAIFDLAKRWQRAKAARRVLGPWWGTCFAQVLKPSKCRISTWQGKGKGRWQSAGKGVKALAKG